MCSWTADLSSLLALLVPLAVDQSPAAWASLLGSSQHGNWLPPHQADKRDSAKRTGVMDL